MLILRSILFYLLAYPLTAVFAFLGMVLYPFPFRVRYYAVTRWTMIALWWLKTICRLNANVIGREHIPPGPAIIVSNHQSAWETMYLQKIFPPHVWVLKKELLWLPLFGWGLATLDPIAIDRKAGRKAVRQIIDQGRERLSKGRWVTIFPQGTRVAPGEKKRYGVGAGALAEETGFPLVPIAHNAGLFWPRKTIKKFPGTVQLVVGPPVDPKGKTAAEITAIVEQWIETTADKLLRGADVTGNVDTSSGEDDCQAPGASTG